MDAIIALSTRSSPRSLGEPSVSPKHLEQVLSAAVRAPDHGRLRPWRFVVIEGENIGKFGDLLAASTKRRNPTASDDMIARAREKALRAPMVIVVAAQPNLSKPNIPQIEQLFAVAASAQNIMTALYALGYGAMWKTGDAAYDPELKTSIGLQSTDQIIGFIYAGTTTVSLPVVLVNSRDFVLPFPPENAS